MADLARDVLLFQQLDLDMIGIGPYIPHPQTPLFRRYNRGRRDHAVRGAGTGGRTYDV